MEMFGGMIPVDAHLPSIVSKPRPLAQKVLNGIRSREVMELKITKLKLTYSSKPLQYQNL